MTEVVSVRFRGRGKAYYFSPAGARYADGAELIVETAKGLESAVCCKGNHFVPDEKVVPPLRPVVRALSEHDRRVLEINRNREREALGICQQKIAEHGLDMKLVDVECSFEGNKITFYFISEGRVDFRELVKDLASVFRSRIELRQIGVRDEAKLLGGLGICGRPFCCSQFLDDFQPVSTKMAKIQSMSLNPAKISGSCGRLMCCLRYEEAAYEDLVKTVPKSGAFVETPAGYGNVVQVNLLRRQVKVRLDGEGEAVFKTYSADDVAAIPGGRPRPGEPLPQLLKNRPAPVREAPEPPAEDLWRAPRLILDDERPAPPRPAPASGEAPAGGRRGGQSRRRGGRGGKPKPAAEAPAPAPRAPQPPKQPKLQPPRGGKPKPPKAQQPPRSAEPAAEQNAPRRSHRRGRGGKPRPPRPEE